jgi:hypothetical protein
VRHVTAPACPSRRRAFSTWLVRGAIGVAAVAVALSMRDALVSIPALVVALIAFRGCPMCWLFGLIELRCRDAAPSAHKEVP